MVSLASIKANAWALLVLTSVLTVLFVHVDLSVKSTFKALRYALLLLVFVFLARVFSSTGSPVFEFGRISISGKGVHDGAMVCWRLLNIIVIGLLFVSTTRSSEIKASVEWFLTPIPFIPAKRVATMMSLILRFIPVILNQAKETSDAQRARGVENRKNPVYRMRKLGIPLMRRTFERADKLAVAMEARCYTGGKGRTQLVRFNVRGADVAGLLAAVGITAAIIAINFSGLDSMIRAWLI